MLNVNSSPKRVELLGEVVVEDFVQGVVAEQVRLPA
jgi:hypothetical protein